MSEEVELKPCAFCGKAIRLIAVEGYFYADCFTANCPASPIKQGGFDRNRDEVIRMWNARPGEQAAYEAGWAAGKAEERERIVAALEAKLGVVQGNEPIVKELYPGEIGSWENALKFAIAIAREEGDG